jgi:hypothetical protein
MQTRRKLTELVDLSLPIPSDSFARVVSDERGNVLTGRPQKQHPSGKRNLNRRLRRISPFGRQRIYLTRALTMFE